MTSHEIVASMVPEVAGASATEDREASSLDMTVGAAAPGTDGRLPPTLGARIGPYVVFAVSVASLGLGL